jgi:hypothetical protein
VPLQLAPPAPPPPADEPMPARNPDDGRHWGRVFERGGAGLERAYCPAARCPQVVTPGTACAYHASRWPLSAEAERLLEAMAEDGADLPSLCSQVDVVKELVQKGLVEEQSAQDGTSYWVLTAAGVEWVSRAARPRRAVADERDHRSRISSRSDQGIAKDRGKKVRSNGKNPPAAG